MDARWSFAAESEALLDSRMQELECFSKRPKSLEDAAAVLISEARQQVQKCHEERAKVSARLAELQTGHLRATVKELGGRRALAETR